jgi:hypothetical protein
MSAQEMVDLIEEMVEIKIRQQTTAAAKNGGRVTRELARVIFDANLADRERIRDIKQQLVQLLETA